MPNIFAYLMIFAWPVLAFVAFRRMPLAMGVSAAMIGAQLLLPSQAAVDLPMIPTYDKVQSGTLAALLVMLAASGNRQAVVGTDAALLPGWLPRSRLMLLCFFGAFATSIVTVLQNAEALHYGPLVLPGLRTYDIFSSILSQIMVVLPFLIARRTLATPEAQKMFLIVLTVAGLLYVLPTLYEVRMSPQLNRQIYGFFPASFIQHVRFGGFRPVVFFSHGLKLSLFLAIAFLAALACIRLVKPQLRTRFTLTAAVLFGTLILSKSVGAFLIALILAPVMIFSPVRIKLLVAAGITAITLTYPVLRGNNLVPVDQMVDLAHNIDSDRAGSLQFRFSQEDVLLEKASQKPFFGWGGWGRSRAYSQYGADISVTDGTWVILFGTGGWTKYVTTFGLLCLPVLLMTWRQKTLKPDASAAAVALLLAGNMIDLIPNSGLLPMTWMMAGALTGRLEWQAAGVSDAEKPAETTKRDGTSLYDPGLREHPVDRPAGTMGPSHVVTSGMSVPTSPKRPKTGNTPYTPKLSKPGARGV